MIETFDVENVIIITRAIYRHIECEKLETF